MSFTFKNLYLENENKLIAEYEEKIISILDAQGKAYQYQKNGKIKEDSYYELDKIIKDDAIYFKKMNNKPAEWIIPFDCLRNALKYTLRKGKIVRATEYAKIDKTCKPIGTPLHNVIRIIDEDDIMSSSIINKTFPHEVFGSVLVEGVDYESERATIKVDEQEKNIMLDFWKVSDEHLFESNPEV